MTRETAQKHRNEINAFADGKDIQILGVSGQWQDCSVPSWAYDREYRIKPREPVIANYDSTEGFKHSSFRPGIATGRKYTFIEMTPEVAEAVKHLTTHKVLPETGKGEA